MKFKVTKKEKELFERLRTLVDEIKESGGTALTFFALGENMGGTHMCGDASKVSNGFYNLLKSGMKEDGDKTYKMFACAILDGIAILTKECSKESLVFASALANIYKDTVKQTSTGDEWMDDEDCEIEVVDDEYDTKEETLEELVAKLDKMGYYVNISKKPTTNNTKKPDKKK